jgi:hypothetical protein
MDLFEKRRLEQVSVQRSGQKMYLHGFEFDWFNDGSAWNVRAWK